MNEYVRNQLVCIEGRDKMGMPMFSKGDSWRQNLLNPNPSRFEIISVVEAGRFWVSMIRYEGCENFEGKKVLLTSFDPRERQKIDPHFTEGGGVVARFEPTERGVRLAGFIGAVLSEEASKT